MSIFKPLPRGPFDVIIADPPWSYRNDRHGPLQGCAAEQYKTISLGDLKQLPVPEVAATDCILLMWCTWPKLPSGLALLKAWGFKHKTGLPWVKTYNGEKPVMGVGYWFRGASEPLLVATRGNPGAPERGSRLGLISETLLTTPRGKHSAKPPDVYSIAEEISEHVGDRRLELFARQERDGWTTWGNQVGVADLPSALQ